MAKVFVKAHPRSRGEHDLTLSQERIERGSSPLARGTLHVLPGSLRGLGLIPARAGNTFFGIPMVA